MRKLLILIILSFSFTEEGYSQNLQIGTGATFLSRGNLFGIETKAHYTFTEDIASQVTFTYYFAKIDFYYKSIEGCTFCDIIPSSPPNVTSIDLDFHYNGFSPKSEQKLRIAPFTGINIFNVNGSFYGRNLYANLNLGLNSAKSIGTYMDVYIEPKVTIGKNFGYGLFTFTLASGIYF